MRLLGLLLAVVTLVFVVLAVVDRWDDLVDLVRDADPAWLVAATLTYAAAEVLFALSWPSTLRRMGHDVGTQRGAATFQLAQMGKFVPGGIWPAVGRVGTARRLGVPPREVTAGWTFETAASVAAAVVLVGLTGAGPWLHGLELALAAIGAGAAIVLGRKAAGRIAKRTILGDRDTAVLAAWQLVVWSTYAVGAGLICVALDGPFGPTIGAFAISWLAGTIVIGAPAGLGVREAVMTAALTPAAGSTTALAVAVGSRAVWTVVSLALAAVSAPLLRGSRS